MSRVPRWLALVGLVGGTLTAVALSSSPASAGSNWCGVKPAPCIEAVTRNGTPVASSDPVWQISLSEFEPGHQVQWNLMQNGAYELEDAAALDEWAVTIDTGTVIPRVVYGNGRDGSVVRVDDGDGTYHVTATAHPTLVVEGCDFSTYPWPCPTNATDQAVRLAADITDWHFWDDPVQRAAFYGVDFWTNVTVNSFPPGVNYNDETGIAAMALEFGAPHFETDGTTVFRGHFETVLPNDFLHENFFIPNPATMTSSSLAVAGGGPISNTSITKASPSAPMEVEVTDMTFTIRQLKVKTGTVVPTRPGDPSGTRVAAHRGRIGFETSTPRGAKVTGYKAACESAGGHSVSATRFEDASPVTVTSLREGVRYTCRVRALSKAGPSAWSTEVVVPRNP
jgi:hypothetical protein